MFAIYFNPLDYPGLYVVREWVILPGIVLPSANCLVASTLEAVRALVPQGLVRLERNPDDEPQIVETWI